MIPRSKAQLLADAIGNDPQLACTALHDLQLVALSLARFPCTQLKVDIAEAALEGLLEAKLKNPKSFTADGQVVNFMKRKIKWLASDKSRKDKRLRLICTEPDGMDRHPGASFTPAVEADHEEVRPLLESFVAFFDQPWRNLIAREVTKLMNTNGHDFIDLLVELQARAVEAKAHLDRVVSDLPACCVDRLAAKLKSLTLCQVENALHEITERLHRLDGHKQLDYGLVALRVLGFEPIEVAETLKIARDLERQQWLRLRRHTDPPQPIPIAANAAAHRAAVFRFGRGSWPQLIRAWRLCVPAAKKWVQGRRGAGAVTVWRRAAFSLLPAQQIQSASAATPTRIRSVQGLAHPAHFRVSQPVALPRSLFYQHVLTRCFV